ncbi:hypothetical protein [Nocardiopsis sp. YSL2]|uniref:hypothetical protein n=1 Tax=Nocardiopsis sp. YSL2 TaxID=2939492 RepID=UPI0026F41F67|nr:hypothetical protein [Nocardiopsis sp. YSL2]
MIILLTILAAFATYLWYGFRIIAPAYVTRQVDEHIEDRIRHELPPHKYVHDRRKSAAADAVGIALVWPFYLGWRALTGNISGRAPLTDHELRHQLEEKDRYIAELERRNGIGDADG